MPQLINESQLFLALQALKQDPTLTLRRAAKLYLVDHRRLSDRQSGIRSRRDISANSRKMSNLEEDVLAEYILDLSARGFPPRLGVVEEMANRILVTRQGNPVGLRWAGNFVRRRPDLRTRFQRKYDYKRALCEDPTIIRGWFDLVRNTIAKYGIQDADIYNFDETGFMMGQISTGTVVTSSERLAQAKKIQPGNREWVTVIQAVSSTGYAIPPFVIFAGKNHLESWYENADIDPLWCVGVSQNGWTTNELGLEWISHFKNATFPRKVGRYCLLVLDGHESHHSTDFEAYCKEHDIITLCMPPHSSHLLQPLDVGCFGPLKRAYGRQIEKIIRRHQCHVTKEDFLPAFQAAFQESFTISNVQGGFRGAGLVPFDPERVISALDLKLRTPTPQNSRPGTAQGWTSQTPSNSIQVESQSTLIKKRITEHSGSSPTATLDAINSLSKGSAKVMHRLALLEAENRDLRQANAELSKRRTYKKRRLQAGGTLTFQEAEVLRDERDVAGQIQKEVRAGGGRALRTKTRARRCKKCDMPGHNSRTCPIAVDSTEEEESD